jgi:molybdopterin-containing oxidoreductase family membrane subunit
LLIAASLRRFLRLQPYITDDDMRLLAKLLAASGLVVAYIYLFWIFLSLLSSDPVRLAALTRMGGTYGAFFWGALALMALVPQALWLPPVRRSFWGLAATTIAVIAGVWLDRFSIMVAGLEKTYLPWGYDPYWPTSPEWLLLIGTLGLFSGLLLLFVRYLPVISMLETHHDQHQEERQ